MYVFGDARSIPALQNAVIDALIDMSQQTNMVPIHQVTYIYENTVDKPPLRRLVVDWIVYRDDDLSTWKGFGKEFQGKCSVLSIPSFMCDEYVNADSTSVDSSLSSGVSI